jgi:hypothetical protein
MEIQHILLGIEENSAGLEQVFISLAGYFPVMLNRKGGSALEELIHLLESLKKENDTVCAKENDFYSNFDKIYSSMFDDLNKKMTDLTNLNPQVAIIKEDSEELELITLNAMVISIKSGEKGRAFSSITENQKQLSNQMYLLSDSLINEEHELLGKIVNLKEVFKKIVALQKEMSDLGNTAAENITGLIQKASGSASEATGMARTVYPSIQQAMEGLQTQDIVRQSLDHVKVCLKSFTEKNEDDLLSDTTVDALCFNIELLKISEAVMVDILSNLTKSSGIFDKNWKSVCDTLTAIEKNRLQYIDRYLNREGTGTDNIPANITRIIEMFSGLMQRYGRYKLLQSDFAYTCENITERTRRMYIIFENLKPVIENLQHIRILQQIEVAKNETIASVRDSVTDMDARIISVRKVLDGIQKTLQMFSSQTEALLLQFTAQIGKDNTLMREIRSMKTVFFNDLKSMQENLSSLISNFTVLPPGFEADSREVQSEFDKLNKIQYSFKEIMKEIHQEQEDLVTAKSNILKQRNIPKWEIRDNRFRELIKSFTITAHKEAAGRIAGFRVEKGSEAGEVTFF